MIVHCSCDPFLAVKNVSIFLLFFQLDLFILWWINGRDELLLFFGPAISFNYFSFYGIELFQSLLKSIMLYRCKSIPNLKIVKAISTVSKKLDSFEFVCIRTTDKKTDVWFRPSCISNKTVFFPHKILSKIGLTFFYINTMQLFSAYPKIFSKRF